MALSSTISTPDPSPVGAWRSCHGPAPVPVGPIRRTCWCLRAQSESCSRLGGMAGVLETRLRQAQAEPMAPIDLLSTLVSDELTRRSDRLLERRRKHACFRDPNKTLDNFDFAFNPKMSRSLVFDLATGCRSPRLHRCGF